MIRKPTYEDNENLVLKAITDTRNEISELDHGVISSLQCISNFVDTCTSNTTVYLEVITAVRDLCGIKSLRREFITTGICEALDLQVRSKTSNASVFEEFFRNFLFFERLDKVKGNEDI